MAQVRYLTRQGDSFAWRRRPPVNPSIIRQGLHTTRHVVVGLRTRDPREAARRAARLNVLFEEGASLGLPVETLEEMLRLATREIVELRARTDMTPAQIVRAESQIEADIRAAMLGDAGAIARLAAPIERPASEAAEIAWRSPGPPPAGPARPARRAANEQEIPSPVERPATPAPKRTTSKSDPAGFLSFSGRFLDRRRAGYLCEALDEAPVPDAGERFYRSSHDNYQGAIRAFADLVGNRPMRGYTRADARAFLADLTRVPAMRPRSDRTTLREAIEDADRRERAAVVEAKGSGASPGAIQGAIEAAKVDRLKLRTIDRMRGNLSQIFAWAVASGEMPENPFSGAGMSSKAKSAHRAGEKPIKRRPWTPAELRTLFSARPDDPAFFWAPRLSIGTGGGRLEEVLSRRGTDFRDAGDGGLLVRYPPKTQLSVWREAPVHSALDEELRELIRRAGSGFLFDHMSVDRKGRRAGAFSRDFGRYCDALDLGDPALDFQGLRGTANEVMAAVGPDDSPGATLTVRQAILGHKSSALADTDYMRGGVDWRGRRMAVERIPLRELMGG